jgi:hypothetical protein
MTIRIDQRGRHYFVYKDDHTEPLLIGQWCQKWLKTSAAFADKNNVEQILIETNFRLNFWKMNYSITIPILNINGKLEPVKIFKGHWRLETNSNSYDFYIQSGHRKSLYKNGSQIAAFDKKYFHLFEKDTFYISANSDEPLELLISFAIAFELTSNNDGVTMTMDFGNLGKGAIPVDMNWRPK